MSQDWLRYLDAKSDFTKSEVNTELLHSHPPKSPGSGYDAQRLRAIRSPPAHLEVETDLSVSIAMSIPYYNISDYKGSFDTVDLLHDRSQETEEANNTAQISTTSSPRFANTSHITPTVPGKSMIEAANVDQVPPRFSKFIADQNIVDGDHGPANSSIIKNSRDIFDLMGSQATIFSTRLDEAPPTMRSRLKKSRSRRSKVFPQSSSVHSLTRQKAIRSKEGSLAYRLRIRMKKIVALIRAKFAPILHYVSKSKRATSTARMPLTKTRSLKKGFPFRMHKSRSKVGPAAISVPVNNPRLGKGVIDISDDRHISLDPGRAERRGKWTHVLQFLAEQQHLITPPSQAAFLIDSDAPPPPPHINSLLGLKQYLNDMLIEAQKEKEEVQEMWRHFLAGVLAQRIRLRQEIAVFQMLLANQSLPSAYSKQVGEIVSSHNASIVNSSPLMYPSVSASGKRAISGRSMAESMISVSEEQVLEEDMSSPEIESDIDSEAETLDLNVEKLHRVLNRRSMLGEMLDYESDSQLSLGTSVYLGNSQIGPLTSQYGTVRRHPKSDTSSRYSLNPSESAAHHPHPRINTSSRYSSIELAEMVLASLGLPRSHGYNMGLNLAQT